jgi:hypothetical protein
MAELILSLSTALSNHDRKTRGHSERTRAYTDLIAEEMELPEPDRDRLRWAALLHDVGKLEVPTEILNKDSSLDEAEWEMVKQHPIHGMRLVAPLIPWLGDWAEDDRAPSRAIRRLRIPARSGGQRHLARSADRDGGRRVRRDDERAVVSDGDVPAAARQEIASMAGVQFDPVVARALMNVSLGKLRWTTGPLAALAQIPFVRGLPQVGRDLAMILTTSAVVTSGFVSGAIPTPSGVSVTPNEMIEIVIAGGELRGRELPPGTPDDFPLAAGTTRDEGDDTPTADGATDGTTTTSTVTAPPPPTTTTPPGTTTTTAPPPPTTTTTAPPGTTTTTAPPPPSTTTTTVPPTTTTTTTTTPSTVVANPDSASVGEDGSVNLSLVANDTGPIDTSTLSVSAVSGGSVTTLGNSGRVRFDAAPGFTGTAFFSYTICGTDGSCSSAPVTITVG